MGDLWRSEEMQLIQLFVQVEAVHDTIDELGKLGLIQFRDLNHAMSAFQRPFVAEVKRADELERKLRFFETQIEKLNADDEEAKSNLAPIEITSRDDILDADNIESKMQLDDLEPKLDDLEKEMQQMNNNQDMLNNNHNELIELKHVLLKDDDFFREVESARASFNVPRQEGDGPISLASGVLKYVTGTIAKDKFVIFERILFRATRGNLYLRYTEVEEDVHDPQSGEVVRKYVFIIFFQGDRLQMKVKKLCESFGAILYPCPETHKERDDLLGQVRTRLDDLDLVINRTLQHRRQVLTGIANQLAIWKAKVKKEKSIYHSMNSFNFDVGRKCLVGEGWCPKNSLEAIQLALRRGRERSGAIVPSILNKIKPPAGETPPTYFRTNKFTQAFQNIVDAYGIARYREINPAVFTIITFPFLFGIMFGDVGHGFMLLGAVLYFIINEKKLASAKLNEIIQTPFEGRYAILLMALFGIYAGFLYNEFFSVPMNIFGTNWERHEGSITYNIKNSSWTYPFGVDPVWKGAGNELLYYNSLKMKMSVIIGVCHMLLGIAMKFLNSINNRNYTDLVFECIPQALLMLSLFGYLVFLIFYKWFTPFFLQDLEHNTNSYTANAPMLLNTMIYMFLNPFYIDSGKNAPLFDGQGTIQGLLLILAGISVPWMLFVKPFILRYQHNRKKAHSYAVVGLDEDEEHGHQAHGGDGHHGDEEEFDFGEIFIHQVIETIEFVLGSVSNTASYLRLWALSLAHSELSTVFWEMGLFTAVKIGPVGAIIGFGAWFGVTIGVLLIMETLSAFLHALRLHWVEFQNKFYKGDGKKFLPFSYLRLLGPEGESQD